MSESDTAAEAKAPALPPRTRAQSIAPGVATVEDHLETILRGIGPLGAYDQPVVESLGLALDEDVTSTITLPRFDTADIDGYAVSSHDVALAADGNSVTLPVVGEIVPGSGQPFAINPGTAVRVEAGAPVPRGADAIVAAGAVTAGSGADIVVSRSVRPGAGVRLAGEDVAEGEIVLEKGAVLGPREIGLLAGLGRSRIRARPRPRVVVISVGPELREPGSHLDVDSVNDSNSYMVAASVRAAGAVAYRGGVVGGEAEAFRRAVSDQLVRADLVIMCGGIGHHDHDRVREALGGLDDVTLDEVALEPGPDQGFGLLFEEKTPVVMLPGDPVSAAVGFEIFALPAIRRMMGLTPYRRPQVHAVLAKDIASRAGVREYVRAVFEVTHRGAKVTPVAEPGAHRIGALAQANALIVVGEDETALHLGDTVRTLVLDRSF